MTNRRSLILALTAAALTPTVTFAAEAGDIFGGILQGINLDFSSPGYSKGVQSQHGPLG